MEIQAKLQGQVLAAAAVLALAGCGTDSSTGTPPASGPSPASSPYALYTHCGINDANIDGHWYRAVHPLSDGSGNPPTGWGNPYQQGTITFLSSTEAVFRDKAHHEVHFVLRPGATRPLKICS